MRKFVNKCIVALSLAVFSTVSLSAKDLDISAQDVAIKTNILYDAALTANIGAELRVAPRWSVDLSGNLNAWTVNSHKWKHWMLQPEARYWFCEAIQGHFVAAHLLGGQYNVGNVDLNFKALGTDFRNLKNHWYQGWYAGLGVAYGYSWILAKHWNFEAELGLGWIYTRYDVFPCEKCGTKIAKNKAHNYVGPTKAALNLVYVF